MPDQRVTPELRTAVIARANGCCEYCRSQARFATQSLKLNRVGLVNLRHVLYAIAEHPPALE